MRLIQKGLFVLVAAMLVAAPIAAAPALSLHLPTVAAGSHQTPALPGLPDALPGVVGLGMAIKIKDTGTIAQKFAQRAGAASGDYSSGVQGAGADWQSATLAAKDSYAQGVQEAIAKDRYSRGVNDAGSAKYTKNATTLGPQRYQQGVANAQDAYARGVQPHLDAMKSANLPPRGPKGSAQNMARADAIAKLNRAIKVGS